MGKNAGILSVQKSGNHALAWRPPPSNSTHYFPPPPPPTEFLTHACEKITFPQLRLRTVIRLPIH